MQLQVVSYACAGSIERLLLRPLFEGNVERDTSYVLVDDVTSMGGTLAKLANFIQINSRWVAGSIVLVNAGRSKDSAPVNQVYNCGNAATRLDGVFMKLQIVLETSEEGGYTAWVPSLPGCISEGDTRDEALSNIKEAVALYLEPVDDDVIYGQDAEFTEVAI